ncbi:MAG: MCE family protein [Campylobacter sp.]|nr:MCE family protein [Campylobacter sp.]
MENRANYFFVGLFVFGVFFISLACIFWLGGYSKEESFEFYRIYTRESVSGLSLKAPVRLLGVEVGNVENISISDKDGLGVDILIKVKKDTPIKEDTLATLQLQGITGLKSVQLEGGSKDAKMLKTKDGTIPVIKFKESFLTTIDRQSEYLFSLLKTADKKSKELLSEKNLKNVELILQNLAGASEKIVSMSEEISLAAKKLNHSLNGFDKGVKSFDELAQKTSNKLDFYDELKYGLQENLELFKIFLLESNALLLDIKRSPADLIFKESKAKLGPGEKE